MRITSALLALIIALQVTPVKAASVDLQIFKPTPSGPGFITHNSGELQPHLALSYSANLNWGHSILQVLAVTGGQQQPVGAVVKDRVDLDLMASVGLWNWGEFGMVLPLVWQGGFQNDLFSQNSVDLGVNSIKSVLVGDIRLVPKVKIFNLDEGHLALAFVPTVSLPTAGGSEFAGESSVTFVPTLAFSARPIDRWRVGVELGARFRKSAEIATVTLGNEFVFKGALGFMLLKGAVPVELLGEIFGNTQVNHPFGIGTSGADAVFQKAGTPVEGDVALRASFDSVIATFGGGGGLRPGVGAPVPRLFLSVAYYTGRSILPDRDNDGVPDSFDKCPDKAEDNDGFEDLDGCPDLDNDKDGVLDDDDQCPNEPEDKDGFQDEDGCPDPDNDNDGIPDAKDKCPDQAEDKDGFEDFDGCPDLDNDKDGIPDTLDKCPNQAEDKDGFEDEDGCPEADNDGDGLPDLNDLCPNFKEDKDGFQDDDGCPDDNDSDGIPDDKDKCPNQPETYNGFQDDDGCPDSTGKKQLVTVTDEKIEIKETVYFKTASAVIDRRSFDLLNQVAAVLKNYQHITKVRIEGHTDNQGVRRENLKLSQARADAVRAYLQNRGIAADRLTSVGYGPDKPVVSNRTPAGRERNRRVEFVITAQRPIGQEVKPQAAPEVQIKVDIPGAAAPAPAAPGRAPAAPAPPAASPLLDLGTQTKDAPPAPTRKQKRLRRKKGKSKSSDHIELKF